VVRCHRDGKLHLCLFRIFFLAPQVRAIAAVLSLTFVLLVPSSVRHCVLHTQPWHHTLLFHGRAPGWPHRWRWRLLRWHHHGPVKGLASVILYSILFSGSYAFGIRFGSVVYCFGASVHNRGLLKDVTVLFFQLPLTSACLESFLVGCPHARTTNC
jgi:hypothetical protein